MLFVALQTWADGYTYYYFTGKMGGKVTVEIAFQKYVDEEDGIVAGYILYPKAKNPAPILLVGYQMVDNWFHLDEYQPDGTITGWLNFQVGNEDAADGPTIQEGEWTNPKTGAEFSLTTLRSPYDMDRTPMYLPDWLNNPLEEASPENICGEYLYQQWNRNWDTMMGGTASFKPAGSNKVTFYVQNSPQNIAEGSSEEGRPAVLDGNVFTYNQVNECGYGFKATFFKKFVVLQSTTGGETFRCFGNGASFDGVYIKME